MNTFKLAIVAALLTWAGQASAHHSFAATFKQDENNTVEGVITEFRFRNPHVIIYLDVTNDDGSVTNWMVEGSSATGWRQSGWRNDSLAVGETLRVTGSATIDGSPMVSIEDFALIDPSTGAVVTELSPNEDPAVSRGRISETSVAAAELTFLPLTLPTGEPNFTGITREFDGIDPRVSQARGPDRHDAPIPYNAVGEAAFAAWPIELDPQVFCDPPGVIRQAGYTPYGQIINQYPDHITIEYEEYGSRRAIFFGDELPKPGVRSNMGDSVARYEGDTLVIETVNLLPNYSGHNGRPLSENARVTEVYSRTENPEFGTILRTDTTVVDPTYLTEPWTITRYKVYSAGYEFLENECEPPLRERPSTSYQYSDFDLQFID